MANPSNDRQARLAALRRDWAGELPARLQALARHWQQAQAQTQWSPAHAELARAAHGLAGSAGSFGFTQLGQVALRLEQLLAPLATIHPGLLAQYHGPIEQLLEELDAAARAQDAPLPAPAALAPAPDAPSRCILIVTADAALATQAGAALAALGWTAEVCTGVAGAHATLACVRAAALLVDAALLPELLALGAPGVPLLALNSGWDWASRLALARAGVGACLQGPLDNLALAAALERLLPARCAAPYRVLLLDDSAVLAHHYAQVLSNAGLQAHAITEPATLLQALAEHQPELLLLDLHMPGCSGIEAAWVIRQERRYVGLPIVFLSTESALAQQQQALQSGADDFLQKPISDHDLIQAVTARIRRFRALSADLAQTR